jgi:hypothetical protein
MRGTATATTTAATLQPTRWPRRSVPTQPQPASGPALHRSMNPSIGEGTVKASRFLVRQCDGFVKPGAGGGGIDGCRAGQAVRSQVLNLALCAAAGGDPGSAPCARVCADSQRLGCPRSCTSRHQRCLGRTDLAGSRSEFRKARVRCTMVSFRKASVRRTRARVGLGIGALPCKGRDGMQAPSRVIYQDHPHLVQACSTNNAQCQSTQETTEYEA